MKSSFMPWLLAAALGLASLSVSAVTIDRSETKDGSSHTVTEVVERSTPTGRYLISAFAIVVGSLIAWWGVKLVRNTFPTTSPQTSASIEVDLGKKKLKFSKLVPSLFVVAIGGIIVIAGIFLAVGEHVLTATI